MCRFRFDCASTRIVIDLGARPAKPLMAMCASGARCSTARRVPGVKRVQRCRAGTACVLHGPPRFVLTPIRVHLKRSGRALILENTLATLAWPRYRSRPALAVRPGPWAARTARTSTRGPALSTGCALRASNFVARSARKPVDHASIELARVLLITPRAPNNGWLAVRRRGETRTAGARCRSEYGMKATTARTT
jgi:hypothetical protein